MRKIRLSLWPSSSFKRSFAYFSKRVLRYSATPHAVSAGLAAGVFASFTPFLGFHLIIAILISLVIRGNAIVASIGTLIGNPLTFPLIWALNYYVGMSLVASGASQAVQPPQTVTLFSSFPHENFILSSLRNLWMTVSGEFGWIMLIGSIPSGLFFSILTYALFWQLVNTYNKSKLSRIKLRRSAKKNSRSGNA